MNLSLSRGLPAVKMVQTTGRQPPSTDTSGEKHQKRRGETNYKTGLEEGSQKKRSANPASSHPTAFISHETSVAETAQWGSGVTPGTTQSCHLSCETEGYTLYRNCKLPQFINGQHNMMLVVSCNACIYIV